jgi:SIT4-associating protein SAP185/190
MFWRFGGYANISTIDTILDKPDFTLEEVLDESDLIQELKQHNSKLIEYLREESVLQRLLAYVIAAPLFTPEEEFANEESSDEEDDEDTPRKTFSPIRSLSSARSSSQKPRTKEQEERAEREEREKTRQKYAYVASEILSSETWSIIEALMENQPFLRQFWEFIRKESPLDPATAGYFTRINETLLDKKTEETLEFIKSLPNIVPAMLRHVDCPMILDLLLKIISMEKSEGGQGIVDVCASIVG